jgi:hypothetical protein
MSAAQRQGGSKLGRAFGGLVVMMLGLGVGALIALSPDIAIPLIVLMLPGIVALLIDPAPGAARARALLLFQGAACINPVSNAWYRCSGIDSCIKYLCGPTTVMTVWLAAAAAWMIAQTLPIALKLLDDHRLKKHRADLLERRKALVTEWGLEEEEEEE